MTTIGLLALALSEVGVYIYSHGDHYRRLKHYYQTTVLFTYILLRTIIERDEWSGPVQDLDEEIVDNLAYIKRQSQAIARAATAARAESCGARERTLTTPKRSISELHFSKPRTQILTPDRMRRQLREPEHHQAVDEQKSRLENFMRKPWLKLI